MRTTKLEVLTELKSYGNYSECERILGKTTRELTPILLALCLVEIAYRETSHKAYLRSLSESEQQDINNRLLNLMIHRAENYMECLLCT